MPTGVKVDEETKQRVVELATGERPVPVPGLAERYGVSRKSIYRWLDEHKKGKENTMADATQPKQQPKDAEPQAEPEQKATTPPVEGKDCINPSCGKTYTGTKCDHCGYDETLAVR